MEVGVRSSIDQLRAAIEAKHFDHADCLAISRVLDCAEKVDRVNEKLTACNKARLLAHDKVTWAEAIVDKYDALAAALEDTGKEIVIQTIHGDTSKYQWMARLGHEAGYGETPIDALIAAANRLLSRRPKRKHIASGE